MKAVCWVTELVFSSHSQFYIKVVLWTLFIPDLNQHEHKENQPQHLQMQTSSVVLIDLICETSREQIYPAQSCLKPVFWGVFFRKRLTWPKVVASVAGLEECLCWQMMGQCWISPRQSTGEQRAKHSIGVALISDTS